MILLTNEDYTGAAVFNLKSNGEKFENLYQAFETKQFAHWALPPRILSLKARQDQLTAA